MLAFLDEAEAAAVSHADLEERLQADAPELFRRLYQDHLDLRAQREARITVHGVDGVSRTRGRDRAYP